MSRSPKSVFSDRDRALQRIREEITAVQHLKDVYERCKREGREYSVPKGMRPVVGHMMFLGPAGCGKTTYANAAAEMMGVEEGKNFHKVSADSFPKIEDFIDFLKEKLTWDGYLCNNGKIYGPDRKIIDPINPRGPVPPVVIYFDEIHMLPKKLQDKFGVILLEFYYNLKTDRGNETLHFPKFTVMASTTDIGLLTPALQRRFKLQVPVSFYSDEEMSEIVEKMCRDKSLKVTRKAVEIIARCSQGVPGYATNHTDMLVSNWIYRVKKEGVSPEKPIDEEFVTKFFNTAKYIPEGFTFDQIELLRYLATGNVNKDGKRLGLGIVKILSRFGIDKSNFFRNWESILQRKGYMSTGTRGREITEEGINFLAELERKYPNKNWSVH